MAERTPRVLHRAPQQGAGTAGGVGLRVALGLCGRGLSAASTGTKGPPSSSLSPSQVSSEDPAWHAVSQSAIPASHSDPGNLSEMHLTGGPARGGPGWESGSPAGDWCPECLRSPVRPPGSSPRLGSDGGPGQRGP